MDQSSGIEDVGMLQWKLALLLFFAWVMVYLCLWKGIRLTGKVSFDMFYCFQANNTKKVMMSQSTNYLISL